MEDAAYLWRVSPLSDKAEGSPASFSASRRRLREGITSHDLSSLLPTSAVAPPVGVFSPAQLATVLAGVFAAGCIGRDGKVVSWISGPMRSAPMSSLAR